MQGLTKKNIHRRAEILRGYRAKIKYNPQVLRNIVELGEDLTDEDIEQARKSKLSEESLGLLLMQLGEDVDIKIGADAGEGINQYY